jgi:dihydropyrimidinase
MKSSEPSRTGVGYRIVGGTVLTPNGLLRIDLGITDGIVAGIGEEYVPGLGHDRSIDAGGCFVLPGGVDAHVHLAMDARDIRTSDDFASGSRAALRGGTTAAIDFVEPRPGQGLVAALEERRAEAAESAIPIGLHMTISAWRKETADEMRACVELGVRSFKIYLAYLDTIGIDDSTVAKVLETARSLGAKVLVHAEDGEDIRALTAKFSSRGAVSPRFHALSRPPEVEEKAVAKIVDLVERIGGPEVVIAHVSAEPAMRVIRLAKLRGLPVHAETCPHYLAFTDESYEGPPTSAARYVMCPPLRRKSDVEFLWSCVADGTIDIVSTDHCPFLSRQKTEKAEDFTQIPCGVGGISERIAFMLSEGHVGRGIPIERIADLVSRNPAELYGLSPRAGSISAGSRADIAIWDLSSSYMYSGRMGGSRCDYSIYEGMRFHAMPVAVFLEGNLVAQRWASASSA